MTDSVEYAENFAKETFEKTKEGEKKMKDEQDEKERKEREEEEKKRKEEEDKKKSEEEDEEEEEEEVGLWYNDVYSIVKYYASTQEY